MLFVLKYNRRNNLMFFIEFLNLFCHLNNSSYL
jgi:hypothetical protein